MLKKLVANKYYFLIELALMTAITFNKNLFSHQKYQIRIYIYTFTLIYLVIFIKLIGYDKTQLGLNKRNFLSSLKSIFPFTLLIFIILFLVRLFQPSLFGLDLSYSSIKPILLRIFYYSIISVPVQELIFRSYVINRLEQFSGNKYFLITASALIFGLAHWPFNSILLVVGSLIFGIFLAINFLRYRNLYTPLIVHSLVGLALMLCILR